MGYIFETLIKKMSTFLLQLPGFKSLHPDDRCAIVKGKNKVSSTSILVFSTVLSTCSDLITSPDTDSDTDSPSDSKPDSYIVL